ncbi:MAG: FG-GAP repeat domain-containing protein, partial [Isosphaeraceae bacterium]
SSPLVPNGFGWPGVDLPAPGDYDGDGKTDPAVYRPTTAQWFAQLSSQNYVGRQIAPGGFGWPGVDIPAPGDYDGSGKTQIAVYRPQEGAYYVRLPGGSTRRVPYGGPNYMDLPLLAPIGALKRFGLLPGGVFSASRSAALATAPNSSAGTLAILDASAPPPLASPFATESTSPLNWSDLIHRRLSAVRPRTVVNQA